MTSDRSRSLRLHRLVSASAFRRSALVGSAFLVLLVFTGLLYSDFQREKDRQSWVTHTYQMLSEVRGLTSTLEQAEAEQRGYLLTGDASYLDGFDSAVRATESASSSLDRLTADNPYQGRRLDAFDKLMETRLAKLRQGIAARQEQGLESAQRVISSGEGRRIMED